jgi:hypothetical protein
MRSRLYRLLDQICWEDTLGISPIPFWAHLFFFVMKRKLMEGKCK